MIKFVYFVCKTWKQQLFYPANMPFTRNAWESGFSKIPITFVQSAPSLSTSILKAMKNKTKEEIEKCKAKMPTTKTEINKWITSNWMTMRELESRN